MGKWTDQALASMAHGEVALAGARAAFLMSGRLSQWEGDPSIREYWTARLQSVFDELGLDREIETLARAAYERFGYVAPWNKSPKARKAWLQRMSLAIEAIRSASALQSASAAAARQAKPPTRVRSAATAPLSPPRASGRSSAR